MAYACPVCDEPQVDAGHLADHVAFTAITGGEAHETWLDETVADWGDRGQSELAEKLVEHAEETEFPINLDEDAVGSGAGHAHDHGEAAGSGRKPGHRGPPASRVSVDDEDVQDVLDEARDMTQQMQGEDADGPDGDEGTGDGGADNETQ